MQRRSLLIATAITPFVGACSRMPDTIKIGVAQPLSGPLDRLGKDMLTGAQMAVKDLNASNFLVDGKPVKFELVSGDDKSDAATGKAVAQQLVGAGVVAVIGHLNSGVSIEAAPIYGAAHIPQLAISTNPRYTQLGLPTTLRLVANDDVQAKAMAGYAAGSMGATTFALIDDATPYGKGLLDGVTAHMKTLGKAVALRITRDDKTTDFTADAAKMAAAKIDCVITTLADFQVEALMKQMAAAGLQDAQLMGGDTIKTDLLPKKPVPLRRVVATSPIVGASEFDSGKPFVERFTAENKQAIAYGAHYAYDAVFSISEAVKRAASADPAKVLAALKSLDLHGPVTNSLRFNEGGEQRFGSISVYTIDRSEWHPVMRASEW
ncbi:branched-chain amino acid ABC transporter substrate-binding protein [Roseateles sp. NT4]|uniref:branched-chain amino acid ABC transporter substrate-binding protein n=1 Tax=Roseateles sp. NT4 TaxID=3453715 RepID=UPI003EE88640